MTKLGVLAGLADPAVADVIVRSGFDWVWLDGEHGQIDARTAAVHAALYRGRMRCLARIPDHSAFTIGRFLDAGVDGLIIPQVHSAEQLAALLDSCFYPPRGRRGIGVAAANGYGADMAAYIAAPPYSIFAQVETIGALAEVEQLLSQPRLGGLMVGPYDLSGALGHLGDVAHPDVQQAIARILAACRAAGKPCGIYCADPDTARACARQGFDLVCMGVDSAVLAAALAGMLQAFHRP
jgi:2-dehydro-3-deoxyglucarate aldolase